MVKEKFVCFKCNPEDIKPTCKVTIRSDGCAVLPTKCLCSAGTVAIYAEWKLISKKGKYE